MINDSYYQNVIGKHVVISPSEIRILNLFFMFTCHDMLL